MQTHQCLQSTSLTALTDPNSYPHCSFVSGHMQQNSVPTLKPFICVILHHTSTEIRSCIKYH